MQCLKLNLYLNIKQLRTRYRLRLLCGCNVVFIERERERFFLAKITIINQVKIVYVYLY